MKKPIHIAIYARYSSDAQSASSVDDQISLCRKLIADQFGPATITVYADAAISGATMQRPGMQSLLAAIKKKKVDMVVAEGLDRLSRSLKDIATIYETLANYGVKIYTSHENWITELHVGLKGTMNAIFLKDLREKTKRGMTARIEAGYAIHFPAYGYKIKREYNEKGLPIPGLREIDPDQAAVVRWIYEQYVSGKSCPKIAGELNERGIPSPSGGIPPWDIKAHAASRPRRINRVKRSPLNPGKSTFKGAVQIEAAFRQIGIRHCNAIELLFAKMMNEVFRGFVRLVESVSEGANRL